MNHILRGVFTPGLRALAAMAFVATAGTAQTISLPDNELPTTGFGKGGTTTFGQTFTTPTGANVMQSFSFWLSNEPGLTINPASLRFNAFVMQWNAAVGSATGPVLYTSAVQLGPTMPSHRYDFATPNIAVSANTQYVAFLSASLELGNIPETDATALIETTFLGTYTGGQFVFTNNGADFGLLTSDPWEFTGFPEYQSHFEAQFASTVVPEPSSLILLAAGSLVLLLVATKRKRV